VVERLAQGHQALAEGRPVQHNVLPLVRNEGSGPKAALSKLTSRFNALRDEFVTLGYGVPPEVALQPHRSDM
jgi:hypothetical protein